MADRAMDYQRAIKEEVKSQQMRDFKTENVQEFVASLAEFEKQASLIPKWRNPFAQFCRQLALDRQMNDGKQEKKASTIDQSIDDFS